MSRPPINYLYDPGATKILVQPSRGLTCNNDSKPPLKITGQPLPFQKFVGGCGQNATFKTNEIRALQSKGPTTVEGAPRPSVCDLDRECVPGFVFGNVPILACIECLKTCKRRANLEFPHTLTTGNLGPVIGSMNGAAQDPLSYWTALSYHCAHAQSIPKRSFLSSTTWPPHCQPTRSTRAVLDHIAKEQALSFNSHHSC
jgi:hypothetical protein